MRSFKWGIIGTGKIVATFAETLAAVDGAVLYAVASRTENKSRDFAERFGFERSYGSYAELAADKNIDAVYIATPMASHYADAKLCLENGMNVLCEKSVTLNTAQLKELLAIAKEKDVFFMEAMWTKCRPAYLKARQWIDEGRIGQVRMIKGDFSNTCPYDPEDRLFKPDCGGGSLLDLAVYPLTLAMSILGDEPDEIISDMNLSRGIDLSDSIILRYPDDVYASVFAGFEFTLRNNAIISGTDGMIVFGDWFHCTCDVTLFDRDGNELERFSQPNYSTGYEYEVEEVQRCLALGLKESPLVPHSGTLAVMRVMDECRKQCGLVYPQE